MKSNTEVFKSGYDEKGLEKATRKGVMQGVPLTVVYINIILISWIRN